jgi:hypothetical protein
MSKSTTKYSCNCSGCFSLLATLCFLWALWFGGLPTFWGKLEIDLIWPAVRLNGITYIGK